jgi:hypothetical protein
MEAYEHAVARVHPLLHRLAQILTRHVAIAREIRLELAGIAEVGVVLIQHVRLAAEAADALEAADEVELLLRLHARELRGRRTGLRQQRDLLRHDPLDLRQVSTRLGGGLNDEAAGDFGGEREGADVGAELTIVDECLVQP